MKTILMVMAAVCGLVVLGDKAPKHDAVMAAIDQRVAEKIGLSAEVQQQVRQIEENSRQTIKELQQKTKLAMTRQSQLVAEAKPDEAAVMAAIDELFNLRKEMAKVQTKRMLSLKALLSPEQLQQARDEMKKLREEKQAKKGKGPKSCDGKGKKAPALTTQAK